GIEEAVFVFFEHAQESALKGGSTSYRVHLRLKLIRFLLASDLRDVRRGLLEAGLVNGLIKGVIRPQAMRNRAENVLLFTPGKLFVRGHLPLNGFQQVPVLSGVLRRVHAETVKIADAERGLAFVVQVPK